MASDPKTVRTGRSVTEFVRAVKDTQQRRDLQTLIALLRKVTGERPAMWGPSIIGFGTYHYVYASGREGDWMLAGLAPRKGQLTVYLMGGLTTEKPLLSKLGKHKVGGGCLYLKNLEGIDLKVLGELVRRSVRKLREMYP
jgi:hypothetical protein